MLYELLTDSQVIPGMITESQDYSDHINYLTEATFVFQSSFESCILYIKPTTLTVNVLGFLKKLCFVFLGTLEGVLRWG